MEVVNLQNNFTIYLMLIICIILLTVDSIELYRITLAWNYIHKIKPEIFEKCVKSELILKTVFAMFSFLSALAATLLTGMLALMSDYFYDKVLSTFLRFAYQIFGPYMLGFSILGLLHWNEVVYMCDRKNINHKHFSLSNTFSLVACFIISLTITCIVAVYDVVAIYMDSILRRDEGSKILRSLFWWFVLRRRQDDNSNPNPRPQNNNNTYINLEPEHREDSH